MKRYFTHQYLNTLSHIQPTTNTEQDAFDILLNSVTGFFVLSIQEKRSVREVSNDLFRLQKQYTDNPELLKQLIIYGNIVRDATGQKPTPFNSVIKSAKKAGI